MVTTPFSALSQTALDSRFQSRVWDKLPYETRLSLCQELENRIAAQQGLRPRTVTDRPMSGTRYGGQSGDAIYLNSHLLRDGVFRTVYQDGEGRPNTMDTPVPAAGWSLYNTVIHEHTHGAQLDQGRGQTAASYISFRRDYALYRIQPNEREAFAAGQAASLAAMERVEEAIGRELPEKEAYLAILRAESYEAALSRAQLCYDDPDIQAVLDRVVADRETGVTPEKPSPTYTAITRVYHDARQTLEPQTRAPGQEPDDGSAALSSPGSPEAAPPGLDDGAAVLSGPSAGQSVQYGAEPGGMSMC